MAHQDTIRIQWLGDIALTAQYLDPANHGVLEKNIAQIVAVLEPADLRIANWEAPLMGPQGLRSSKRPALNTNEETARKALALKLDVALLANNHVFDCLESGYDRTVSFLESAGIGALGAGKTLNDAVQPLLMDVVETPVAILAYVDESTHPRVPADLPLHLNWLEPQRVLDEVAYWAARKRTVLVHVHCGSDFVSLPSPALRNLARNALNCGASVVVCYHPHRIQGYEYVRNGFVLYSPGNFLVGSIYPWPRFTQPTTVLTCEIKDRSVVDVKLQHFLLRSGKLQIDSKGRGTRIYRTINRRIAAPEDQYVRLWTTAAAVDHLLIRPWHFVRRHKNPFKMFGALEKRHFMGVWNAFVSVIKNRISGQRAQ